jgi:polysaccharide export outer membrane protein
MKKCTFLLLLTVMLLGSCKTPQDIAYLQDVKVNEPIHTQGDGYIRFQPGDKLSIYVHSRDQQLMELFNISGRNGSINNNANGNVNYAPYTIDTAGEIDFPVLGTLKLQGLTRDEVAKYIKDQLIINNLCKDPIVTVAFYNMNFSVLGNAGAGVKQINKDRITLLEALAMASDLQINGLRKNVLVMRQEGDMQVPYRVDLTSAESIYNSPVYYIRQNDVIYVEPNDMTKRSSTVMGSSAYTPSFWFGMFSTVMSAALLIYNILK